MKQLIISLCLLLLGSSAYAGKATDDILFELSLAKRFLATTESQDVLWNQVILDTRQFPDKVKGTKTQLKQVIISVLDDDKLTYVDIHRKILTDFYLSKKYEDTMQAHYAMTNSWAIFDNSLGESQRKEFRNKMHTRISMSFRNTSDKVIKNIKLEDLSSETWSQRLNITAKQRQEINVLYNTEEEYLKNISEQIAQYQLAVNGMLSDNSQNMSMFPTSLKSIFLTQQDAVSRLQVYYQQTYNILSPEQQQQVTAHLRAKLRFLKFIL